MQLLAAHRLQKLDHWSVFLDEQTLWLENPSLRIHKGNAVALKFESDFQIGMADIPAHFGQLTHGGKCRLPNLRVVVAYRDAAQG